MCSLMYKAILISVLLFLVGCDAAMRSHAPPKKVVKKLKTHFILNKSSFDKAIDFVNQHPEVSGNLVCYHSEKFLKSERYESFSIAEKNKVKLELEYCPLLLEKAKIFPRGVSEDGSIATFLSHHNTVNGYQNDYRFIYFSTVDKVNYIKHCEDNFWSKREKIGRCFIQLNNHWYLEYSYISQEYYDSLSNDIELESKN